jgi:hypothetical protein
VRRVSKRHGVQLVKASAGRWSARREALFLAGLRRTGCVRSAAAACGLSTNALYKRREKDDDFRMRWREAEQGADERIPGLLTAAAIAALDPEIDDSELPPCSVREAIHICRMKGLGTPAAREQERRRTGPRVATNAEVRAALEKSLRAFSGRVHAEKLAQGWTEDSEGRLIPPGWVYAGTDDEDAAAGGEEEGERAAREERREPGIRTL